MSDVVTVRNYVKVTAGQTVHLRTNPEIADNVITELPRGYCVIVDGVVSPYKKVIVDDCIDTIKGYVQSNYLTNSRLDKNDDEIWYPRYSTTQWKRSKHSGKYYLPVKRIQQDLYKLGYTVVGTADGYFGKNTETAVKAFQSDHGLTVDGVFGKNSKQKLWDLTDRKG
jgi:hypothetical protein